MIMRIRELREDAEMTQQQLANGMGVVRNAVSNWENEISLPQVRQLPALAELFGCRIEDLFYPYHTTGEER